MGAKTRRTPPPVDEQLLQRPREFAFIQAVRLLKLKSGQTSGQDLQEFFSRTLRVRPHLSLGFPGTDVSGLEETEIGEQPQYRLTASFLGLYGPSSPLPTFYTEELLDEAREDHSGLRDFLDILNNNFFIKLYKIWSRNRPAVRIAEEGDEEALERAFCLMGLGHESLRNRFSEPYQTLRYTGLLTQYPRSALGLQTALADRLGGLPVRVEQCLPQKLSVPQDQRIRLGRSGNELGQETVLGCEITESMGKIGIHIGPLDRDAFQRLLPGSDLHAALEEQVALFRAQALSHEVRLTLERGACSTCTLGSGVWSRLGLDTWLFSEESEGPVSVTFPGNS